MKVIQQTIASFGSPMWIEPLQPSYGSAAVIAQWRNMNGRLGVSTADAIRVCLSLSTGQQVRHAEPGRALSKGVSAGDVIVLRPGIPTETTHEGDADVLQIFIQPENLGQITSNTLAGALVAFTSGELKRAVIQLFVAARHNHGRSRYRAEVRLRQIVDSKPPRPSLPQEKGGPERAGNRG